MGEQGSRRGRPPTGNPRRVARSVKLDPAWLGQADSAADRMGDTVSDLANRAVGVYAQLHGDGWVLAGEIAGSPQATRSQGEIFAELVGIVQAIQWQAGYGPAGERISILPDEDVALNAWELDAWLAGPPGAEFGGWRVWRGSGEPAPVLVRGGGYRLVMLAWAVARAVRWAFRLS